MNTTFLTSHPNFVTLDPPWFYFRDSTEQDDGLLYRLSIPDVLETASDHPVKWGLTKKSITNLTNLNYLYTRMYTTLWSHPLWFRELFSSANLFYFDTHRDQMLSLGRRRPLDNITLNLSLLYEDGEPLYQQKDALIFPLSSFEFVASLVGAYEREGYLPTIETLPTSYKINIRG